MKLFVTGIPFAWRLTLIYLLFGCIWIYCSDWIVHELVDDNSMLMRALQTAKGTLFVFGSGVLLFFIGYRFQKKVHSSLNQKREWLRKYTALSKVIKEGIVDYDFGKDEALINEQMQEFLGIQLNVVKDFVSIQTSRLHPMDRERLLQLFQQFIKSNETRWQAEYRYQVHGDGFRDIISRGYLIRDLQSGAPLHLIYSLQDVTELNKLRNQFYDQQLQHQQELTQSILRAQEQEKNRWAEELHDNVGQVLTVSQLLMEQVYVQTASPLAEKAKSLVQNALGEIRQLSAALKPPTFGNQSLNTSIESLLANINRVKPHEFSLIMNQLQETNLKEEHKLVIYRVVQEQLHNIVKYAEAKKVLITLTQIGTEVVLTIQDNGKGFDPKKVKTGIGLRNIESRLQAFGGTCTIESENGKGCRLQASFTINQVVV